MTDMLKGRAEIETPVNPYSLLEAVNDASDTVNTGWLIFLAVVAYVLIAVAGVTHKDLLLETPVTLPIMQVSIQQKQFFTFAPILLVLFHLGIVAQLVLLARKTIAFDQAVRLLESTGRRTHPLRLELHNFFFVQAVAGPHRSRVMSTFLHGMSWLTTVVIPVILLLYIQVAFLPYHDVPTTWIHRLALVADLSILLLIGTFLLQTETSFFAALVSNTKAHPLNVAATAGLLMFMGFMSFFVATVPGELLDRTAQVAFGAPKPALGKDRHQAAGGFSVPFFTAGADGALFGIFRRNLVVTDTDLVVDKDVTPGEPTLKLRGRDLRYARLDRSDLHQADMTSADLSEASLNGTDLRGVWLNCADLNELILSENRKIALCAAAREASFVRARLDGAHLTGTDLSGAHFDEAQIDGADLSFAHLTSASFSSAHLDKTDMTGGIHAEGANFLLASLQGADLSGAQLQGADFSTASMQGAVLSFAHLEGAVLRDADLEGATLHQARLQGSDLTGAKITAADFHGALVWQTIPPPPDTTGLADFAGLQAKPLDESEIASLISLGDRVEAELGSSGLKDTLAPLLAAKTSVSWGANAQFAQWKTFGAPSLLPDDALKSQLTSHLGQLMCRARWGTGGIATGVLRRAQAQQFRGDVLAIFERSKRDDCPAAKAVPDKVLRGLAGAAEAVRTN